MKKSLFTTAISGLISVVVLLPADSSSAFFLDGNGHMGLLGETRLSPDFQSDNGMYQATRVSFDLRGEVRANDRASFNLRLGLTDDPSGMYLGDSARPKTCEPRRSSDPSQPADTSCDGRSQSAVDPGYKYYTPVIREAYGQYAFNYCILTAGRRSRKVGLGAFLDAGDKPFDTDASIFDGVTCDVNIQKHQDLGFTFGVDKLQETGHFVDNPYDSPVSSPKAEADFNAKSRTFGPNDYTDDMDQLFLGINYDDLKSKVPGSFAKQVGIYFANVLSTDAKTDIKYFDLFTGFYYGKIALKNELIFRLGKSADPAFVAMGGQRTSDGSRAVNNVNSIGLAGSLEYTFIKSGAALGPEEFNEGSLRRHIVFSDYAYAPGDYDGYFTDNGKATNELETYGEARRDSKAKAMAFHRNYHPAMLFFNSRGNTKKYYTGGVFDPTRVMNTALYSLGYRYENMESGNIEVKAISGRLIERPDADVVKYYDASTVDDRPMGFYGTDLGYELDLTYSYHYQREVDLGLGFAAAMPGKAWRASKSHEPQTGFGFQGSFAIKF